MKFLLSTWGSLGDLHPFLALAQALALKGHGVTLAANPLWRETVEKAGFQFLSCGPEQSMAELCSREGFIKVDPVGIKSLRRLVFEGLAPVLRDETSVLIREAPAYDVLVAHHIQKAATIAAEHTGVPFVSVQLAPGVQPSRHYWPGAIPWPPAHGWLAESMCQMSWTLGRRKVRTLIDPWVNQLRVEYGLRPVRDHFFRRTAPMVLHLYSPVFRPLAPDWSGSQVQAGFGFWNPDPKPLPEPLKNFLAAGPKPWLVTLGSAVVHSSDDFLDEAMRAFTGTTRRAILLTGRKNRSSPENPQVWVTDYLPFASIMPRCAGAIHQCGIGTSAETLRAGIPTLACPYAYDQWNNAAQLARLGVARVLSPRKRTSSELRIALDQLEQSAATQHAQALSRQLAEENGMARAVEALERFARAYLCPQ